MDSRELEDVARGEFEAAMAFGVSFDSFHRLAKTVRERCAKDCEAVGREHGECPEMATYCADRVRGA